MITSEIEEWLHPFLKRKANALGCIPHAIGGIEDHIHIVVSIPPKISVSNFVKRIKGASAHDLNEKKPFAWQKGYGVFTMGSKQLDRAVEYVRHQKAHHKSGKLIGMLEQTGADDGMSGE